MEYIDTLVKLTISLMAIIIVTRLLGKKEMSQVTPLDFVYTLILGGSSITLFMIRRRLTGKSCSLSPCGVRSSLLWNVPLSGLTAGGI
ncbi:hypothetical protein U0355_01645 [Salimicrobium sp. PL1-032A]|uniref:hypothetical protein n=1 Tax=Salimicrobium sp. PL1-032A TaxID=3095364 RepID=UPI00326089E6